MTFDELIKIKNPEKYPFKRAKEVGRAYERKLKLLEIAGVSHEEHILAKWTSESDCMVVDNEFPYDWEDCTHRIIWWRNTPEQTPIQEIHARLGLAQMLTDLEGKHYVIFRSEPKNQSVKGLLHYHVITRR